MCMESLMQSICARMCALWLRNQLQTFDVVNVSAAALNDLVE